LLPIDNLGLHDPHPHPDDLSERLVDFQRLDHQTFVYWYKPTVHAGCFAKLLRSRRESLGLTQYQVSYMVGVTQARISQLESAQFERPTSPTLLAQLVYALKVKWDDVLDSLHISRDPPGNDLPVNVRPTEFSVCEACRHTNACIARQRAREEWDEWWETVGRAEWKAEYDKQVAEALAAMPALPDSEDDDWAALGEVA
jgi:transcriptional regulator with XRE-family HTH domain